jgi:TRAP-type C4-dicarboxylate transport system substrate-binding protein
MTTWNRGCVAAAACGALTIMGSQSALGAATWKISIWGQPRASTAPFEWFAKEVATKTGGQLKMEFTYNKIKAAESADLLNAGTIDGGYFCSPYLEDKMPLTTVLDLPVLAPQSYAAVGRVMLALSEHPAIQAELKKWNAKMLVPAPGSQFQLMSIRPIAKLEDFRGTKMRAPADIGKIFQEFGASVVLMPGTEVLAAMKSGAVDVAVLPYPFSFAAFKVQDGAKYVTDNISLGSQFCYLAVSHKAWEALPADVQTVMLGLRKATVARYETTFTADDDASIAAFKKQGLQFVSFSAVDRARIVAKAIKVWQGWVVEREKQGLKGKEVFEFTQAKIREFGGK